MAAFLQGMPELPEAQLLSESSAGEEATSAPPRRRRYRGRALLAAASGLGLLAAGAALAHGGLSATSAGGALRGGAGATELQEVVTVVKKATDAAPEKGDGKKEDDHKEKKTSHTEKKDEDGKKAKEEKKEPAPPACKRYHADAAPGLFCWGVMFDDDQALLTSQLTGKVGMFACNDYAVISPLDKVLGKDECGAEVRTWQENLPAVKKGMYGVNAETSSWLNVPIFLICWDRVIKSGKVWEQDFTVKLDPDAVFFPERLRPFLEPHKGQAIFTTDCRFWGGDQVGKLFGAIEVLSKQAMGAYKENAETCKNLGWQGWGEDMWMQNCMDNLKIPAVGMFDQVSDGTCPLGGYQPCSQQDKIVFHPQKDAGKWWECWKQSQPPAPQ